VPVEIGPACHHAKLVERQDEVAAIERDLAAEAHSPTAQSSARPASGMARFVPMLDAGLGKHFWQLLQLCPLDHLIEQQLPGSEVACPMVVVAHCRICEASSSSMSIRPGACRLVLGAASKLASTNAHSSSGNVQTEFSGIDRAKTAWPCASSTS